MYQINGIPHINIATMSKTNVPILLLDNSSELLLATKRADDKTKKKTKGNINFVNNINLNFKLIFKHEAMEKKDIIA